MGNEKVILEQISSQSFEHPADRAALEGLKKTVGFDRLMRAIAKYGADRIWRIVNESSNLRLSEKQVGSVYGIHREVCRTLDVEPPPLYLQHDVRVNAYTAGVEAPFVVVTSGLVEGFSDDELACVIGHELGHMLAGHVLYGMVARSLGSILTLLGNMGPPILGPLLEVSILSALMYWQRCAELTADRAGLLAVQDPRVALSVEMKLSAGPGSRIARELDLDAFMEQARQFEDRDGEAVDSLWRSVLEMDRSHPWPVKRARELDRWVGSGDYERILGGDFQRRARSVLVEEHAPRDANDPTSSLAAGAETAIRAALGRSYGVHVAPRIPEDALHLALGRYVESLEPGERVIALYDRTVVGHGDRGVVLTDRRTCSSARPQQGVYHRDVRALLRSGGGLFSDPALELEGVTLRFHTRAVRDAFAEAISGAVHAFRGERPRED
ncbi:MAG: M48 family metallopeptidase [Planctomycetota bacterium]